MKLSSLMMRAAVVAALAMSARGAYATCTFGASSEPTLQASFNTLLGASAPNAVNDCVAEGADARWTTTTGGATILLEIAGNANQNRFGIYDLGAADPNSAASRIEIFQGNDGVGSTASISLTQVGSGYRVTVVEDGQSRSLNVASATFGFYLQGQSNRRYFSDTTDTTADPGVDHLYAYRGTGGTFQTGPAANTVFGPSDYILAWEDLPTGSSDRDFQDFVALIRNVTPVPLPTAVWLLASGLIGLAGVARRHA